MRCKLLLKCAEKWILNFINTLFIYAFISQQLICYLASMVACFRINSNKLRGNCVECVSCDFKKGYKKRFIYLWVMLSHSVCMCPLAPGWPLLPSPLWQGAHGDSRQLLSQICYCASPGGSQRPALSELTEPEELWLGIHQAHLLLL